MISTGCCPKQLPRTQVLVTDINTTTKEIEILMPVAPEIYKDAINDDLSGDGFEPSLKLYKSWVTRGELLKIFYNSYGDSNDTVR